MGAQPATLQAGINNTRDIAKYQYVFYVFSFIMYNTAVYYLGVTPPQFAIEERPFLPKCHYNGTLEEKWRSSMANGTLEEKWRSLDGKCGFEGLSIPAIELVAFSQDAKGRSQGGLPPRAWK